MSLIMANRALIKSGISFVPEFQAVYDYWTIKPDDLVAIAMNTMVKGWIDSGVWAKKDRIFVFAVHTNANGEALVDWKNPGVNSAVLVNAPVFTAFEGFATDGATQHIDTNYNPVSDGVLYLLNSASVSVYSRTNIAHAGLDFGTLEGSNRTFGQIRSATDTLAILINASTFTIAPTVTDSRGLFEYSRVSNTVTNIYQNGSFLGVEPTVSLGIPNLNLGVGAIIRSASVTNYCARQYAYFDIGGGITATDALNKMNYFEAYMDSNGRGVIP